MTVLNFDNLLNHIVKRITLGEPEYSSSGDIISEYQLIDGNIAIRLSDRDDFEKGTILEDGYEYVAEMMGFVKPDVELEIGDYLFDTEDYREYLILFIDETPGGVTDHHKELYLTNTNNITGKAYNIIEENIWADSFEISWSTYIDTDRAIEYSENPDGPFTRTSSNMVFEQNGSVTVTGLTSGTTYYYRLISKTPNENEIKHRLLNITTV